MVDASHPLIFMHVPKTGGMSIFAGLCEEYGTNIADMYNMTSANTAPAASAIQNANTSIYCGHFPFGLHEWFSRPCYYAAVVREPVSRILSLYFYIVQYRSVIHKIAKAKQMNINELFSSGNAPDYYEDFLAWLEGEESLELFLDCPSAEIDNGMVRRFSSFGLKEEPCPNTALEKAKENIEKYFSVVGVLEQYPMTLQLMRNAFDWPWLAEHRVNVGPRTKMNPGVPDPLKKRVEAMNSLDMALYEWIVQRFEKQLANPTSPILVDGDGRTDFEHVMLWKAVGRSPLREAAMKSKGLPSGTRAKLKGRTHFITPPIA